MAYKALDIANKIISKTDLEHGDTHCDYDLIVEHQLNIKKKTLEQTEDRLLNKKDK